MPGKTKSVDNEILRQALIKKYQITEEILLRQIRDGDSYKYNYYCFQDRQRNPWVTADFQLEWRKEIKKAQQEGYSGVVIKAPIEHAKTEQIARSYLLEKIGENPNIQCALVSNTSDQAVKDLGPVKQDIEVNESYHKIYPKIKPERREGRNQKWTDNAIIVERDINSKDYTVEAVGIHGAILGTRLDLIIMDDPCDPENTSTPKQRKKAIEWVAASLLGRLVKDGFVVVIMTAWYDASGEQDYGDIGYELIKKHNFKELIYRAIKDDGSPLWPEQFSPERIEHIRKTLGSVEFERQMMNKAQSDKTRIFKSGWFDKILELGANFQLVNTYTEGDLQLITGVDLATRKGERHDLTVFFTIGVNRKFQRRILNIIARQMEFPEIIKTFKMLNVSFPGTIFKVETNAAQIYVKQDLVDQTNLRVRSYETTSKTKRDPLIGIPGMGVDFENGKWIAPKHPEVMAWIQECLAWTREDHTGDRLMASFLADSEISNENTSTELPSKVSAVPRETQYSREI